MTNFHGKADNVSDKEFYRDSRMLEMKSFMELRCFITAPKREKECHRLCHHRFVDRIKANGTNHSRFCIAACNDKEHGLFTAAPSIDCISLRLLLAAAVTEMFPIHVRDVKKRS